MLKIIKSSREDILRRKEEYERDYNRRKAVYDVQNQAYDEAVASIQEYVQEQLENELNTSKFPALHFNINVRVAYTAANKGFNILIQCNEDKLFAEESALSWEYRADVDYEGNLTKSTSSWSGLKAVTPEQLDSLRQTLEALEVLNSIDWESIMDTATPDYQKYVVERNPDYDEKPDFDTELLIDDAQSNIGSDIWFKGRDSRGREVWINFLGETPKYFKVATMYIPENADDDFIRDAAARTKKYPENIRKDQITKFLTVDCETMEVES